MARNAKPLRPRFHGELRATQTASVTITKIRVLADTLTPLSLIQAEYFPYNEPFVVRLNVDIFR